MALARDVPHRRRRPRRSPPAGHAARRSRPVAYDIPEPADELIAALAHLSPKQRACVVLHHYAGYPVKEIATIVGSTAAAVRVHLSQGRKRLRTILGSQREDDDA